MQLRVFKNGQHLYNVESYVEEFPGNCGYSIWRSLSISGNRGELVYVPPKERKAIYALMFKEAQNLFAGYGDRRIVLTDTTNSKYGPKDKALRHTFGFIKAFKLQVGKSVRGNHGEYKTVVGFIDPEHHKTILSCLSKEYTTKPANGWY